MIMKGFQFFCNINHANHARLQKNCISKCQVTSRNVQHTVPHTTFLGIVRMNMIRLMT